MTHPVTRSLRSCEAALVLDDGPNFLIRELADESDHAGAGRAVLDHPEDFAFGAMPPESMVVEVSRGWVEPGRSRTVSHSVLAVAVEAGTFAVIEDLPFFDDVGGVWQRTRESARVCKFVGRHPRLHHVLLGSRYGSNNETNEQRRRDQHPHCHPHSLTVSPVKGDSVIPFCNDPLWHTVNVVL